MNADKAAVSDLAAALDDVAHDNDRAQRIHLAGCYLEAAAVAENQGFAQGAVLRMLRHFGDDPAADADYQTMLAAPVTHHYGGPARMRPPASWPHGLPAELWCPAEDTLGNLLRARLILDTEIARVRAALPEGA